MYIDRQICDQRPKKYCGDLPCHGQEGMRDRLTAFATAQTKKVGQRNSENGGFVAAAFLAPK